MSAALAALRPPEPAPPVPAPRRRPTQGAERPRHAAPSTRRWPGRSTPSTATCCSPPRCRPRQRELLVLRVAGRARRARTSGRSTSCSPATPASRPTRSTGSPRAPTPRAGRRSTGRCSAPSTSSIDDAAIGDDTWAALAGELDEQQLVDLVFTVGAYDLLAMAFRSFGVRARRRPDLASGNDLLLRRRSMLSSTACDLTGGDDDMAALRQARRGQLDRALPRARHRPGVLRGLDLARALRARARGDLPAHLAERRPRRAAAARRAATSPRSSTPPARRSIVVRGTDGEVRAFHNICRHRGNKLVWNDFPREETSGTCRQFTCKYHGWRYDLEGDLTFVQQEAEFFDLDKADYGLVPGAVRGVGGVHLREPRPRQHDVAARLPRRARRRPRGLPVRRDDRRSTSTAPRSGATGSSSSTPSPSSTTHRFCTRSRRSSDESRKLQGYGYEALAYEHRRPARHGVVVGRHVAAEGPRAW